MGLFVRDEDGQLQGWLAALLCCWAAYGEDERGVDDRKKTISNPVMCNEQPVPYTMIPPHAARPYVLKDVGFTEADRVRPISERPPSLKPLDLGEASLMGRFSMHARRKSSTTLLSSPKSVSVGHPANFRRLDYSEKQRRSLKPLQLKPTQLEPVVLRGDFPLTEAIEMVPARNPSTDTLSESDRRSYRESRGTPFERVQQMSSAARHETPPSTAKDDRYQLSVSNTILYPPRPILSEKSSSSSMRSMRRQGVESVALVTLPSRPSMEKSRLKRRTPSQLTRRPSAENHDLEKEILELNTIVEERRAEAARPQSPDNKHVPAVAPLMTVRARSETLTDIGSAFSRPLRVDTSHQAVRGAVSPIKSPVKSRLSRPFTNMPDPNADISQVGIVRRPSSRVTGWLSSLLQSSSSITTIDQIKSGPHQPFYQCVAPVHRRAVSETSLCTTVTENESPQLTATSSPVSKSHSRSLTAESRMTPLSPPSTACTFEYEPSHSRQKSTEPWPVIVEHPSQVGLAL